MKLRPSKPISSAYTPEEFVIFYTPISPVLYFGKVEIDKLRLNLNLSVRRQEANKFTIAEAKELGIFLDRHGVAYKYEVFEPIFKRDFVLNGTPS